MKKILLFSAFLVMQSLLAQQDIDFTIKYDNTNSRYEVYAKPNFTQNNFTWGPSQITVVTPASFPDQALLITSHAGGSWGDNSTVYAPAASSSYDFHGVSTGGQLTNLVANQEKLIFTFVPPTGNCVTGLRLFINGTDPNSSQPGMGGGDFNNSIDNGSLQDVYNANYNNTGTVCTLSNENVSLTEVDIVAYPNPVVNELTISGLSTDKNSIQVYAYNGKILKTFETIEESYKLDFSAFSDGVYFIRILNSENNYSIKKVIKKQ
jgi:hypothetical protein